MKENRKIARVFEKFYMVIALVALILVMADVFYAGYDSGMVYSGENTRQRIENEINTSVTNGSFEIASAGQDMCDQVRIRMTEMGPFSIWLMIVLLFVMWIAYYTRYQRGRTGEFLQTLPIKNARWRIQPFGSMLGIIITALFVDGIGLLLIQTHYNRIYADLVQQKGLGTVAAGFVANANVKLVTMLLYYMLVVVAAYVWISFWMMVTKNKLVGGIMAGAIPVVLYNFVGALYGYIFIISDVGNTISGMMKQVLTFIYGCLDPMECMQTELIGFFMGSCYGHSLTQYFLTGLILVVIGIICTVQIANHIELSKGIYFYNMGVEVFFSLLVGMIIFFWTSGLMFAYSQMTDITGFMVKGGILAVIGTVLVFCAVHNVGLFANMNISFGRKGKGQQIPAGRYRILPEQRKEEFARLFHMEWKEDMFFFLTNCLWIGINVNVNAFSLMHMMDMVIRDVSLNGVEYTVQFVYNMLGSASDNVLSIFFYQLIVVQLVWYIVRRLLQGYKERTTAGREFMAGLPISRKNRYWYNVVRDCVLLIAPVILTGIMMRRNLIEEVINDELEIRWADASLFGIVVVSCIHLLVVYGIAHWVEMLVADGIWRTVASGAFILAETQIMNIFNFNIRTDLQLKPPVYFYFLTDSDSQPMLSSDYDVLADQFLSAFYQMSNPITYIGYAIIGILLFGVLLFFAKRLYEKQDLSKNGLYFSFAKYVFAAAIAGAAFLSLIGLVVSWWHRILIIALTIVIFVGVVYCFEPDRKLMKRQKVGVVK